jgi:hypothetical protein
MFTLGKPELGELRRVRGVGAGAFGEGRRAKVRRRLKNTTECGIGTIHENPGEGHG